MELALLAGLILGFRFRIGLVLVATVAVLALNLGVNIVEDDAPLLAFACAAFFAATTQTVALLVHALKVGVTDAIAPRA